MHSLRFVLAAFVVLITAVPAGDLQEEVGFRHLCKKNTKKR
jgi:hypothetical protein